MRYEFTWGMLVKSPYAQWIVDGVLTTFHLAMISWCLALTIGILVGICRVTSSPVLRFLGAAYVELFRNIPLLVQLFIWLYVVPQLLPEEFSLWWNRLEYVPYWTAVVGISFYTASRVAEQVRSAILAIPAGQFKAALSTGLTTVQMYRHVILPYAMRVITPAITSEFLTTFKNTSLAMTIGVMEITGTTRKIEAWSFRGIEAYTVASLTYLVTTFGVIVFMTWLERRYSIPGLIKRERAGI